MNIATSVAATTTVPQPARVASPRGVSTLMYVCQQGDVEKVRRTLRAQPAELEKRDRTGKTPLHYCCTSDNICAAQAADLLVMAAPDLVEARDEDGFTPLHLAVIAGNMPLVTFLLANNADINAVDSEKHTVVHWATVCGETGALRAVLAAGAPVSTPDVHGGYPLHYAAQMCGGDKDSVLGLQVLHALLQHPEVKVNVEDGDGRQPLLWAASAGSANAVLALIRAGAAVEAPDKDGLTALHCAASRGHTDCIDTLLTLCGMSADVIDSNGCTALHYSVTLGHADATAILLAHGADPNRQDRKGRSPAHCGCAKGQFETVKMIGGKGANLWLRNARGDLPLHEATASGRRDLVKWLLEARPSQVNARNNDGRCPLHLAALNDNSDMCKILLDSGTQVNPVLRTSKNIFMTPLDCALQRGFRSTAKYLQLHGGVPASRLGSVQINKLPNGGINLQSREDTILGYTTDSERENGEKEDKIKRKQKKKLFSKHERKKSSLLDSEDNGKSSVDKATDNAQNDDGKHTPSKSKTNVEDSPQRPIKPNQENISYNSEVKITNNYGGINIEKNGEILIGDTTGFTKSTHDHNGFETANKGSRNEGNAKKENVAENLPDTNLAKTGLVDGNSEDATKLPQTQNDNNEVEAIIETVEKALGDIQARTPSAIDENIEEIKSLANTIQQSAKNITKEVKSIQQNLLDETPIDKVKLPDQHSLMSNTSVEESEENRTVLVEASVHEPPKELSEPRILIIEPVSPQAVEENIEEIKVEPQEINLELEKEAINNTPHEPDKAELKKEESIQKLNRQETIVDDSGSKDISTEEKDEITEIETTLPKDPQDAELCETERHIQSEVEEYTKLDEGNVENDDGDEQVENIEAAIGITDAVDHDNEMESEFKETQPNMKEIHTEDPSQMTTVNEIMPDYDEDKVNNVDILQLEKNVESKKDEEEIEIAKNDVMKQSVAGKEKVSEDLITHQEDPNIKEHVSDNELDIKDNKNKHVIDKEAEDAEGVTAVNLQRKADKATKATTKSIKEKTHKVNDDSSPKETKIPKDSTKGLEVKSKKKQPKEKSNKNKANEVMNKSAIRAKETIPKKAIERIIEVTENPSKDYRHKTSDRKHKSSEDSSVEEKSSEEEATSTSSESSFSRKKHRSFTILENNIKSKKTRSPKDGRSRSEEPTKEEKYKRSKIPTPVSNLRRDVSKSDRQIYKDDSAVDSRIPSLPNLLVGPKYTPRSEIQKSAPPRHVAYSDNERTGSDAEEVTRSAVKRKRLRKRMKRDSKSAGSDYESSNLIDSGFEPSPRSSQIPKFKNMTERGVNMTSVTQTIQTNIRRYHLERKIFQHLLELKRLQIRSGQHNETVLVKRAIDEYHHSCASTVGAGRYVPQDYSFKSFEKFLYHSLRKLQKNGSEHLRGLPETPDNPLQCTQSTHRCLHATHAYTGVPCAAYLPKMDHHSIPKIGFSCKPMGGFLPQINPKKTVTLELCHGGDKQVISLPTDRLDQNKRYYVTFTVKGHEHSSPTHDDQAKQDAQAHRHSKSV